METLKYFHLEQLRVKNWPHWKHNAWCFWLFQTEKLISINEPDYEGIKELILLGLNNKIIDGDVLWTANGSPASIYYGTRLDKFDGNSEGSTVGTSDGACGADGAVIGHT